MYNTVIGSNILFAVIIKQLFIIWTLNLFIIQFQVFTKMNI